MNTYVVSRIVPQALIEMIHTAISVIGWLYFVSMANRVHFLTLLIVAYLELYTWNEYGYTR
jgi:hypothetical protein